MHIITVTTFYPNSADLQRAVFVKHLTDALAEFSDLTVIAPVPYVPPVAARAALRAIPVLETSGRVTVWHPRYLLIPKSGITTPATYCVALLRRLKRVAEQSSRPVIHIHCAYPDGVGAALAARRLGIPYAITAHGSDINVSVGKRLYRRQIRWALRGARAIIAVSSDLRDKVTALVGERWASRVHHVPCAGFWPDEFAVMAQDDARTAWPADDATGRAVVFIGNLVPIKGLAVLMDAWALLVREAAVSARDRLLLIGDGAMKSQLVKRSQALGIDHSVRLLGARPHSEIPRWIAGADVLCLPSYNEGTPNVIIEALACGRPVVASRVGGIPEVVEHSVNGVLVAPGKAGGLADALKTALQRQWDSVVLRNAAKPFAWPELARANYEILQQVDSIR